MELPDFLKNRRSKTLNETARALVGSNNPPHISIMGNRFTLVDAGGEKMPVETLFLDVCIVDHLERKSKIYFGDDFDPANPAPPLCWSDNGIAPSSQAAQPQAARCDGCEWNVWGSATSKMTGKGIKACRDFLKLACVIPGDDNDIVYLLRVPPGSHKNWDGYVGKFAGTGVDLSDAVTRLSFQAGVQGTLTFGGASLIDQATFDRREELLAAKRTDALVGRTDVPRTAALPAPEPAPQPSSQASVPPWVPQPASPPEAPSPQAAAPAEPVKRRRGRPAAEASAQPAGPALAPFRPTAAPVAPTPASPPGGNGALFGMQQGATPPSDVGSTLDNLFPSA